MKEFSKTLKEIRIREGLTQKEIAAQLNIPMSTYRLWEYGTSLPHVNKWNKIKYYFDDELNEIYIAERMKKFSK